MKLEKPDDMSLLDLKITLYNLTMYCKACDKIGHGGKLYKAFKEWIVEAEKNYKERIDKK